uniref:Ribonuclease H-like domain-containing protein n=1 Tax=Tanacetum cinerariifolium TaxID=118510 RepID=A0A6L2NHE2_TANCI|nr:ribonuclease H-like domain-containing protein [Tanacetum cinerariifolium]
MAFIQAIILSVLELLLPSSAKATVFLRDDLVFLFLAQSSLDCNHGSFGAFPSYKANHRLRIHFHVERSLDFSEESIEKSWGKESANESGLKFILSFDSPSFSSSSHVFASPVSDRGNIIRRTASFLEEVFLDVLVKGGKYVVPTGRVIVATSRYVVPTSRVIVATGRYVVPTGSDNDSDDASIHNEATNTQQQPNIQPQIITTISNNNAKFPYLKKDEYERESKARTTLLQSIPDDHVADFHYINDARDIWNAVKARFGGNAESKKMRKSMLKQEFLEFRIGEAEGLQKGYDRVQKILSQLNQLKAKPEDEDINLKFLRALPSSWSQDAGDAGEFALMGVTSESSTSCDSKFVSNDFVSCDDCDKSLEVNTNDFASSDSSVKSLEHKPTDSTSCASTSSVSTSINEAKIKSNVETPIKEPISVWDLPSFTCNSSDKNEHTSRTSCNKNGYINKKAGHFRKNASSVSKLCFICGSGTHLIKDCDFYEKQMANKTVGIRVGPVYNRNKVNYLNQFIPQDVLLRTGKVHIPPVRPQPVPTDKPKVTPVPTGKPRVSTPVPTSWPNRPFLVPTDRGYSPSIRSVGIDGQLLLSPQQVVLGKHIEKVYTGYPRTIVDLIHLHTDDNVADLLTKALDGPRYVVPTGRVIVATGRYVVPTGRVIVATGRKKVVVNEAFIRHDLKLNDVEGTSCLFNAVIFKELARMSAKTTSWNEFSSTMASAIICLANNQNFNFSKYILTSLVKNLEASVPFYMFPKFIQVFVNHQLGDMSHHKGIFVNPSLTKKVFANMKRVGTGLSGVVTPLFGTMMVQALEEVGDLPTDVQDTPILDEPSSSQPQRKHKPRRKKRMETKVSPTETNTKEHVPTPSNDPLPSETILSMQDVDSERIEDVVKDVKDVVATAENVKAKTKAKGFTMQEPSEFKTTLPSQSSLPSQDKDKGNGLMVEPEMPLIRKDQIALDEEVARGLKAEWSVDMKDNIDWNKVVEQVQSSQSDVVRKYQALKRKHVSVAQARKNMMIYLKNIVGYKMDYFKGMSYEHIRLIFEMEYNNVQAYLNKIPEIDAKRIKAFRKRTRKEKVEKVEKDQPAKKQKGDELKHDNTKKQKLEEQQEAKELKKNLQIVPNDEDDVFVNVTPLSSKPPTIMDYKI